MEVLNKIKVYPRKFSIIKDFIGFILWIYVLFNVFFSSVDYILGYYLHISPLEITIAKSIFVALLLVVVAYKGGKSALWGFVAHIFFFPLIVLTYRIPVILLKIGSWNVAVGTINAFLNLFVGFRITLTLLFITVILLSVLAIFENIYTTAFACILLILSLSFSYARAFASAFSKSKVTKIYSWVFSKSQGAVSEGFKIPEDSRGLAVAKLSEDQIQKINTNLNLQILYSRFCLFTADSVYSPPRSWRLTTIADLG